MTVKHVFQSFLLVVTVSFVQAQQLKKAPAPRGAAQASKTKNTLLWQISGKDLREPSYLFGTMHVLCAEDAQLSPALKQIIAGCKKIYFEIDMDNMEEMMGALKYIRMNDGVKLSDLLTPEEYARFEAFLKKAKTPIPAGMLNRFKPAMISSLLGESAMDCKEKDGMEKQIMKEASTYDKPIMGLETVEYQAGLFDSIPYAMQAKDLMKYIDSTDQYKVTTRLLIEVYRQQNLDRMDSLVRVSDPGMNNYMDLLLYNRNQNWVRQMPGIMMEGNLLFAVGAGHLPGENGVLNLLRKRGYKITPLKN